MRSERQHRIEELFEQALECPEDDREAFVKESCGQDGVLLASLEALLRSDKKAGSFLSKLVTESEEEVRPDSSVTGAT